MRKEILLMKNWTFTMPGKAAESVDLPHTWNALDGQDGGNDYLRTACTYSTVFPAEPTIWTPPPIWWWSSAA